MLWNLGGIIFLILGIIGAVLPVVPTTPFLLIAAACFLRGSVRMYSWMMTNRYFGDHLRGYREGRGVRPGVKAGTIALLWLGITFSSFFMTDKLVVRVVLLSIAVGVTIHVLMIKTRR